VPGFHIPPLRGWYWDICSQRIAPNSWYCQDSTQLTQLTLIG
jgi:hypothetical protein